MTERIEAIDELIQASSDSLFAPETLEDIRCRLSFIEASECNCNEGPHENALHDLADDDVPVLLRVVEKQAADIERLKVACKTLGDMVARMNQMALDITGLHHLIGEDGDGDWAAVWENLAAVADQGAEKP